MNNSIIIQTTPSTESLIGKSHWWGAPDLPSDVPYPYVMVADEEGDYAEPLNFICQIRLADIAALDPDGLLPHKGMLYIFAAIDHFLGEWSPIDLPSHCEAGDRVRVIYVENIPDNLQPYEMHWEGTDESVFSPAEAMTFAEGPIHNDCHAMLSIPYQEEVSGCWPGYVSLLQIAECDRWGLRFYDCGTLYLLIRPEDLRKKCFDRIVCDIFSY